MRRHLMPVGFSLFALILAPALVRAQAGPGPLPFSGRSFGGRILGVEGCVSNGWRVHTGTPGYAAQITRQRTEAVLNGSPVTRTSTELAYRDNTGVTYQQITLPDFGNSGMPRTVICVYDPNLHIRLVINPDKMTAREFQLPAPAPPSDSNASGNSGGRPPWSQTQNSNATITHPDSPAALSPEISTYCPDATDTKMIRRGGQGTITIERVDCPSLHLQLYSQVADPHGIFTTTAMITATGTGVNLASLPIPYPLPSNYTVTVVPPGPHGGRNFNASAPPSTQQ